MTRALRFVGIGLLTTGLEFVSLVPNAMAQAFNDTIVPSVASLPAGSYGASLTATVENPPQTLNFSLCFTTGYGSTSPIVPSSFAPAGSSATVAFTVPASTIQQVPPSAFTSGSFPALLYAVPATATSCAGTVPSSAATIPLKFPTLVSMSLSSAPQFNGKLTSRLPTNITLTGTGFLAPTGSDKATSSAVSFIDHPSRSTSVLTPGTARFISPTSLVSNIPITVNPNVAYAGIQVCNTTAFFSYCSNVRNLTLTALPKDSGTVTATPSTALPTQKVGISATFGSATPTVAGAPGGIVSFQFSSIVIGKAPLILDSTGTFVPATTATTLQATSQPTHPILADFNQDGVPDLLLLETPANTLHIVLGSSPSGSFAADKPISPLPAGTSLIDLAAADFNGDGFPDIALLAHAAGSTTNTVYLLINDGSGSFAPPVSAVPSVFGSHLLAADFNHDGLADLVLAGALDIANDTGLQAFFGDGAAHFISGPSTSTLNTAQSTTFGGFQIAAADLNGDGFPDIAVLNGANASGSQITKAIAVFQNDGKGNFAAPLTVATDGTASASFSIAPLASGQLPALLVATSTGLSIAPNQSAATIAFSATLPFTAVPGLKRAVFGDFNGDGNVDAAVDDGSSLHVLTGDGKGSFTGTYTGLSIPSHPATELLAASDVNLDTYSDLLTFTADGANTYTLKSLVTAGTASASLPPAAYPVGVHGVVARTPGTFYLTCASVNTTLTVNAIPTSISVSSSVSSSATFGQSITLAATISDRAATGRVTFYNGAVRLGSAFLVAGTSSASARFTSALPAGHYALTAVYAGDATHAGASSSPVAFQILQATPALAWATPVSVLEGTQLSAAQLDALATGVSGKTLPGVFTYTPSAGTPLAAGTQTLKVVFTPADAVDYTASTASVSIVVVPFALSSLSSELALLGDPDKAISLTGTGFLPTATVLLNGSPVATTYISSTTLVGTISAANFLKAKTFQVSVSDGKGSPVSASLPFYVVAPLASVIFSGPTSIVPGTQITLTFKLTNPYPVPLTATFTLGFVPGAGLPADPNVLFASGTSTYTTVIPANSTASPQVTLQTGTVVGAITVGLDLMAGGTDVTPASVHPLNIQAPATVPGVTSVSVTASGKTLTVTVRGFSNTRELTTASFHFTPAPGKSIGTKDVTLNVTPIFAPYYADTAYYEYGSAFTYTQTFDLSSDASVVGEVTVTLSNSVGASSPASTP